MNCKNCGAALPARSNVCQYCHTVNDTDLGSIEVQAAGAHTDRDCPRCSIRMQSLDIGTGGSMIVERCEKCLGIFFDPGELETVIDQSVKHVYDVDHTKLKNLIEEEGTLQKQPMGYVACPVCKKLMNRKAMGSRSGVVSDRCKEHGIWLDGGELGKVLKWAKAGGQIYNQQVQAERERNAAQLAKFDATLERYSTQNTQAHGHGFGRRHSAGNELRGLLSVVGRLLG